MAHQYPQQIILKTVHGRARVGSTAVCWQGATTRRARAPKAEQRRQRAAVLPTRVRSAFTQKVMGLVCEILVFIRLCQRK